MINKDYYYSLLETMYLYENKSLSSSSSSCRAGSTVYPWPLSRHFSLSFIALGRSSGQHLVSSYSCWMYVHAGRAQIVRNNYKKYVDLNVVWIQFLNIK